MAATGVRLHGGYQSVFPSEVERNLVSLFLGPQKGIFVEVGAYEPIVQSQSYHLEVGGWDGVLVEPVPAQAQDLRKARRAQVFEVACVGPEAAERPVNLLSQRGLSTLHFKPGKKYDAPVIEVTGMTLNQVLVTAGVDHVDFLSVDVEGAEPDVLRGFDFARYRPKLALVDDLDRFGETRGVMAQNQYKLVRRTGHNGWFVPRNEPFPVGVAGKMQLAWAYGPGRLFDRNRRSGGHRSRPALLGI